MLLAMSISTPLVSLKPGESIKNTDLLFVVISLVSYP